VSGRRGRVVLGTLGIAVAAYGAWLLFSRQDLAGNLDVALWAAGGVVVHDAVLAPLVIGICALGSRLLPGLARGPVAGGLLVLGTLTVLAVPFLGGWGREHAPDNATLLDRDYTGGYLVLAGLVGAGVGLGVLLGARRARRGLARAPEQR
jgi:hypothetical protein